MGTEIICESTNPSGTMQAIVERDEQTVYLYLRHQDGSMLSCWARNLAPAPAEMDVAAMEAGRAPMLPIQYCAHPQGSSIDPNNLRIVWMEEENGAGVYEGEELLVVIPSWADGEPCPGFARDCIEMSPLAFPLGTPSENALHDRMAKADAFWKEWAREDNPRTLLQKQELDAYEKAFGQKHSNYYAIDGHEWPPQAVALYNLPDRTVLVTIGMALRPQPGAEFLENAREVRRVELGVAVPGRLSDEEVKKLALYLSSITALPWSKSTWVGEGHTVACDAWPGGSNVDKVRLTKISHDLPKVELPDFRNDPVELLWGRPVVEPKKSWLKTMFGRG